MLFEICMKPPRPPAIPDDGILRNKKTGEPILWSQVRAPAASTVVTSPAAPNLLKHLKDIEDQLYSGPQSPETFDGLDQLVDSHKPGKYWK